MSHFVLTTYGTRADFTPFVRIGAALHERGHSVALATSVVFTDDVRAAGLEPVPLDTEDEHRRFRANLHRLHTPQGHLEYFQEYVLRRAWADAARLEAAAGSHAVVVAHHFYRVAAQMVAEKRGFPFVSLYSAPTVLAMLPLQAQLLAVVGGGINGLRARWGVPAVRDWAAWLAAADAHVGTWPSWFSPSPADAPRPLVLPGFFLPDDAEKPLSDEAREVLAPREPLVLIAAGSSSFEGAAFFRGALEACARASLRALVLTRYPEHLPEPLPEGVLWRPYEPYRPLLERVAAVVHHGGMGTLGQALLCGVPQIVYGGNAEHAQNGRALERLGAGRMFAPAQWRADTLAPALIDATSGAALEGCRRWAERTASEDAPSRAAEALIERLPIPGQTCPAPVRG